MRRARTALQAATATSAVLGAVGLALGLPGFDLPVAWLEPLPFDSWRVPAVALVCLVALPLGTAAAAELRRASWADALAQASCGLLLIWLMLQYALLGPQVAVQVGPWLAGLALTALTIRTCTTD